MLNRFLSQLIRDNKERETTKVKTLKQIELFILKDTLKEALQEVDTLFSNVELNEADKLQIHILKSLILTQIGNFDTSLELGEQIYLECQRLENPILIIDAIISLANTNFRLDKLDKCLDLIDNGEKLLSTITKGNEEEIIDRTVALTYLKGKVFWKKGELDQALKFIQESFSFKEEKSTLYETADYQNILGILFVGKGEFNKALYYFQTSLKMFEELGMKSSIVKSYNNIGLILWKNGNLREALGHYKMSLSLSEELKNNQFIAVTSLNIGLIYWNMGELDKALNYYQKSLEISEEIKDKDSMASCFNNIGIIYQFKGELDQSLEYYQKSLALNEELGIKPDIALCLNNIGEIYHMKGSFEVAKEYFTKSLILFEEVGDNYNTSLALYNLVLVSIDSGLTKDSQLYLQKLQEIYIKEDKRHISQKFRLAKAILLKESERVINIAEAQKLLYEVAQEEMISLENNVTANLNLCELLLQELRATGNEEILMELKEVVFRLVSVAEGQNSYIWLAKTYWLQSKIALLEFDLERSQELLTQAELIANEKGLTKLLNKISSERDILLNQFNKWEHVLDQKPSVSEIIELTQIEAMVERMIQKKLDTSDEEVMQYAIESRRLVDMWDKH
ncbi:MAG: tetratricopeptide repeat protein [Promethearchaeota archaeon]